MNRIVDIIIQLERILGKTQYLPLLVKLDVEIYRGEYKDTAEEALEACQRRIKSMKENNKDGK